MDDSVVQTAGPFQAAMGRSLGDEITVPCPAGCTDGLMGPGVECWCVTTGWREGPGDVMNPDLWQRICVIHDRRPELCSHSPGSQCLYGFSYMGPVVT